MDGQSKACVKGRMVGSRRPRVMAGQAPGYAKDGGIEGPWKGKKNIAMPAGTCTGNTFVSTLTHDLTWDFPKRLQLPILALGGIT